jgi:acetyltransferase-like isoleucine patch superfamily enzyme
MLVGEGDVRVGDDCWLGPFTVVTAGTEIGDNTVVDSQSVVTRDLPPYCIAAGAPAEVQEFKTFLRDDALAILAEEYRDVLDADLRIRLSVAGVL